MVESTEDRRVVATLHVLEQSMSKEQRFSIQTGETSLGRGKENDITIVKKGISKSHAVFLVEGGDHFIKDCGSKNNTYRRIVKLRPDTYYELVDQCILTFGDLKCQYLFSEPSTVSSSAEADYNKSTLPYVDDCAVEESGRPTPDLVETVSLVSEVSNMPPDCLDTAFKPTRSPVASTAVCNDTVPQKEDIDGRADDKPTSPPASPDLLGSPMFPCPPPLAETNESNCGGGEDLQPVGGSSFTAYSKQTLLLEEDSPEVKSVQHSPMDGCEDLSTLQYSPPAVTTKAKDGDESSVSYSAIPPTVPYGQMSDIEPTVPYNDGGVEPTVPYSDGGVEPTVPYNDGGVEPTVPYMSDSIEPTVLYVSDTGGTVPYQRESSVGDQPSSPIGQTVPYRMADDGDDDETDIEDELPDIQLHQGTPATRRAGKEETNKPNSVKTVKASPRESAIKQTPDTGIDKCSEEIPEQICRQVSKPPSLRAPQDTPEDQIVQSSSEKKDTPAVVAPESPPILDRYDFPVGNDDVADPEAVTAKLPKKRGRSKPKTSSESGKENAADFSDAKRKKQTGSKTPIVKKGRSAKPATPSLAPVEESEDSLDSEMPVKQPKLVKGKVKSEKTKAFTPVVDKSAGSQSPASFPSFVRQDRVKVLFTGVEDKDSEKIIVSTGGAMAKNVYECSHLVTDKMRRTMKFLCCLARGCHIVSFKWIEKCRQQKTFVDGQPFILKDRTFEKQHSFNLVRSIDKASAGPGVLTDYCCFLSQGVKPNQEHLTDIIQCAGGSVLKTLPDSPADNTIVVASEEEASEFADAQAKGFPVYTTEFVFSAILKQELALSENRLSCGNQSSSSQSSKADASSRSRKRQADSSTISRSKRSKR